MHDLYLCVNQVIHVSIHTLHLNYCPIRAWTTGNPCRNFSVCLCCICFMGQFDTFTIKCFRTLSCDTDLTITAIVLSITSFTAVKFAITILLMHSSTFCILRSINDGKEKMAIHNTYNYIEIFYTPICTWIDFLFILAVFESVSGAMCFLD